MKIPSFSAVMRGSCGTISMVSSSINSTSKKIAKFVQQHPYIIGTTILILMTGSVLGSESSEMSCSFTLSHEQALGKCKDAIERYQDGLFSILDTDRIKFAFDNSCDYLTLKGGTVCDIIYDLTKAIYDEGERCLSSVSANVYCFHCPDI